MSRPHRVAVLALDGVVPFDLGIPSRIFGHCHDDSGLPRYDVRTCSVDGRPVRTSADFAIAVEQDASLLAAADTVIVPTAHPPAVADDTETPRPVSGPARPGPPIGADGMLPQPVEAALSRIRPGTRVVSFCSAAFVLAAAGLLDGRPAATHWMFADALQRTYPRVKVDPDVLFVDDGDVLTSAGAAAGVDLCLHLLRRDQGSAVANQAARRTVVSPWRDGGQAQYIERPVPEPFGESTASARAWALRRLHRPVTLDQLAEHAKMSRRTFTRRFREEVGLSVGKWLTQQRIDAARKLLETSDLSVDRIALDCGFGTAASLRQHLRGALGVSPMAYRRSFRTAED